MRRTVKIASLGVLVVVVAFSIFLATRQPAVDATSAPSPLLGKAAPALSGRELGGGTFALAKDRGDVVVVNFWSSWCAPCVQEAPNLSTFAWQQRLDHVKVVGVVFNDTLPAAAAFAAHYGSLYPSIDDPNGALANRYGVTSPPTTFVIDARGRVAATLLGAVSVAQLDRVLARVRG
jgi:cytochrome c biogenesis protein CcmG/thiol:disulfide interchange protein DsbE